MTDYASQGKTRSNNVVDLSYCKSHQSYYTALSRNAICPGTAIVQSFSTTPITEGTSGWLRQEFRELELLDEITKLRYESRLPKHINGCHRNTVIRQFREWKGCEHVPKNIHPAIGWSKYNPFEMQPEILDSPWKIVDASEISENRDDDIIINNKMKVAEGSIPVINHGKRKSEEDEKNVGSAKKLKLSTTESSISILSPRGLIWDSENWSCSYDSMFVILYYIWIENPHKWNKIFKSLNPCSSALANGFQKVINGRMTLEQSRDHVRGMLNELDFRHFPQGHRGASVGELAREVFKKDHGVDVYDICDICKNERLRTMEEFFLTTDVTIDTRRDSIAGIMKKKLNREDDQSFCAACNNTILPEICFPVTPKILAFNLLSFKGVMNTEICVANKSGRNTVLHLRGLIYHGSYHFSSRIIMVDGSIQFYDGILTGRSTTPDGNIRNKTNRELLKCRGKKLCLAVYAQK